MRNLPLQQAKSCPTPQTALQSAAAVDVVDFVAVAAVSSASSVAFGKAWSDLGRRNSEDLERSVVRMESASSFVFCFPPCWGRIRSRSPHTTLCFQTFSFSDETSRSTY